MSDERMMATWNRYKPSAQLKALYLPTHTGAKACPNEPEYEATFRMWSERLQEWSENGYATVNLCRDCTVKARTSGQLHDDCREPCGWYLREMQDVQEPAVPCYGRSADTEDACLILSYMGKFRLGRYVR